MFNTSASFLCVRRELTQDYYTQISLSCISQKSVLVNFTREKIFAPNSEKW